jgi:DNA-binding SARP family transcriptional activator
VLDGLHLRVDGQTFPSQRWEDRRKARNALALMVAAGGRVAREELINGLWDACDIDDAQAAARLSTVLSVVRRALGAGTTRAGSAKRALVLDKTHVELILGADDTTDIADLRAIELAVATCDPREDAQLARHAADMTPMLRGIPLRGCGSGYVVEQRRRELHADLIRISSTIVQRWLVATSADGVSPPHEIRQLAQMLTLNAPLDEAVAHLLMNIFVRAGQTTDASQAYHRYRTELARELGLAPSPDFSRAHAALIVDDPHH